MVTMSKKPKTSKTIEFGDFQTPVLLAREACRVIGELGFDPRTIVEPTCGVGNFLLAALDQFPNATLATAVEINEQYFARVSFHLEKRNGSTKTELRLGSFFDIDWSALLAPADEPILILGNPPWVTNAELGSIGADNLPVKSNFQRHRGMDAITGKSNFDISEWMLMNLLGILSGRRGMLAMLCKTSVARRVLAYAWKEGLSLKRSRTYGIDAAKHFGAAVDACFLVCETDSSSRNQDCSLFRSLRSNKVDRVMGFRDGQLIAETGLYNKWLHLRGKRGYRWRSGVKHDCARVMELRRFGDKFVNGLRETVELEDEYLFPMLKSSDLANGRTGRHDRWMLVTQKNVGEETGIIRRRAPRTWKYLLDHSELLERRASAVYRNKPRFSIFGVGKYTFAPWKVAISGFYKDLTFQCVGSFEGKPVVLDDTAYSIGCQSQAEADYVTRVLNSSVAREFFAASVFWDSKRPITVQTLEGLDFQAIAFELGSDAVMRRYLARIPSAERYPDSSIESQQSLFPLVESDHHRLDDLCAP